MRVDVGCLFTSENDSCKTEQIKSRILEENVEWTTTNCKGQYYIQAITESKSDEGWNQLVHIFGNANSVTDLEFFLNIFKTLNMK